MLCLKFNLRHLELQFYLLFCLCTELSLSLCYLMEKKILNMNAELVLTIYILSEKGEVLIITLHIMNMILFIILTDNCY